MPYLYCKQHGEEHQGHVIGQWRIYRDEGESVLIVSGKLITGPWLCDSCNAQLSRGTIAYLVNPFPRWITESIYAYDFKPERRYFAMKGEDKVAVYGTAWPCGDVTTMLREEG